jgi:excisionase family DNA binding protein
MKQPDTSQPDLLSMTLYSVDEVADILGVSVRTIYRWIREGSLLTKRIGPAGRLTRVTSDDLSAFINRDFSEDEHEK